MISNNITIFLRRELSQYEKRTPLTPNDVKILLKYDIPSYVQSSKYRIFNDIEYQNAGAIIVEDSWYEDKYKDCIIIGLKELDNLERLNNHIHVYFSHSYKNQVGSKYILERFKASNSILYDFEYFVNSFNKRVIGFGIYAGYVGTVLGLKHFYNQSLLNLSKWNSYDLMINDVKINDYIRPLIGIIGHKGNCGTGIIEILQYFNLNYEIIDKNKENKGQYMKKFDILYNSICLDNSSTELWFDKLTIFTKKILIVDISCDYTKPNNPINIYDEATTFENPVYKYNNYVDIIAINNLPSLLPKDSSMYFSKNLLNLLLEYDKGNSWVNNMKVYYDNVMNN
jgi:saccharopine dehydrogenase (NAD+, L-lysine-forming)